MRIERWILKAIAARDPDGGSVEPTAALYAAHKAWAVAEYGQAAWDAYTAPWDPYRGSSTDEESLWTMGL
jgi:hypothetical protein